MCKRIMYSIAMYINKTVINNYFWHCEFKYFKTI